MKNLLIKELKLSTSPITYFFILFSLMTLLPGYPILLGSFFVSFGIFQSFQNSRENNDILYTILLPVKKSDTVKAKFAFVCFIEIVSFIIMTILTFLRMTLLSELTPYVNNALMNANPPFLSFVLIIFGIFNIVFVRGFFKTAYKIGVPFIIFIVITFVVIFIAESLHFFPNLHALNLTSISEVSYQWLITLFALIVYLILTFIAYINSQKRFEKVDF